MIHTGVGAESGSQEQLERLNKMTRVEEILEVAEKMQKAKLLCGFSFFLGTPHESKEDMVKTFQLMQNIKRFCPNYSYVQSPQIFRPYPGSKLYDEALELPNSQEALQMIQEPFESLMLVIQSGVAKSEPEEEVEATEDGEIAKALSVITQELGLLRAEVSTMKSQPQNVLPKQPEVPIRRSISPELFLQPITEEVKSSTPKLYATVRKSVIG